MFLLGYFLKLIWLSYMKTCWMCGCHVFFFLLWDFALNKTEIYQSCRIHSCMHRTVIIFFSAASLEHCDIYFFISRNAMSLQHLNYFQKEMNNL